MIEIADILSVEKYIDDLNAVIFDLDDTLYSEKDYVRSGYRAVSRLFPEITHMEKELWEAFLNGEPAIDVVLNCHGLVAQKDKALHTYRFHSPDIQLYPGVKELITRIRARKKIGIITDGRPEGQRAKLDALGVFVDEIIITDELGGVEFRKPNELAFRLMSERLMTPFEKMVYIGDNIKKDFFAPEKLGMRCVYFKNPDGIYSGR